jgi:hypothetical protein
VNENENENSPLALVEDQWRVVLVLDNREVLSKHDRTYIQSQLLVRTYVRGLRRAVQIA